MHRGTDIVDEPRQRQLSASSSPPDFVVCFEDSHRGTRPSEGNGCREPVGPGANDDGIHSSIRRIQLVGILPSATLDRKHEGEASAGACTAALGRQPGGQLICGVGRGVQSQAVPVVS